MRQDIHSYLNESGFEISMAALSSMQGKDYRAVFNYLVLTLDPYYPLKEGARFEEEFIPALKVLLYPYHHQIDLKWLAAVASPHSWPYLLGVLHWLVELCKVSITDVILYSVIDVVPKMRNEYLASGHPTIQDPEHVPDKFDDPFHQKALEFQYYEETYTAWLDGRDDFTPWNEMMEERYRQSEFHD